MATEMDQVKGNAEEEGEEGGGGGGDVVDM